MFSGFNIFLDAFYLFTFHFFRRLHALKKSRIFRSACQIIFVHPVFDIFFFDFFLIYITYFRRRMVLWKIVFLLFLKFLIIYMYVDVVHGLVCTYQTSWCTIVHSYTWKSFLFHFHLFHPSWFKFWYSGYFFFILGVLTLLWKRFLVFFYFTVRIFFSQSNPF